MPHNRKPRNFNSRFELRLTAADKRKIEIKAQEAKMSVSVWIRHRLLLDDPIASLGRPVGNSTQDTAAMPAMAGAAPTSLTTDAISAAQSELWD